MATIKGTLVGVLKSGKKIYKNDTASYSNLSLQAGFDWTSIGYEVDMMHGRTLYLYKDISIFIPENFVIVSAFIKLGVSANYFDGIPYNSGYSDPSMSDEYCYPRKVTAYKVDTDWYYAYGKYATGSYGRNEVPKYEIPNVFGVDGYTFTAPAEFPPIKSPVGRIQSIDIKNYLNAGDINVLRLQTREPLPDYVSEYKKTITHTGPINATVVVSGYMKG